MSVTSVEPSCVYVGVQGSYKSFEMALFENGLCLQVIDGAADKVRASSQFLLFFQKLLINSQKKFSDIQFLAVDQGPGAFTSLRVIIASVNALAFNTGLSLVGVDGLDALAQETFFLILKKQREQIVKNLVLVSLLNAYNNDVYYAVHTIEYSENLGARFLLAVPKTYKKIDSFLEELSQQFPDHTFLFTGNGAILHKELIYNILDDRVIKPFSPVLVASAQTIGDMGFLYWKNNQNISSQLTPLYLKAQTFAVRR